MTSPCSPPSEWRSPATDAAEILGAAATLRGHDDRDDTMITLVRQRAVSAIGTSAFEASYAAGRALSKDAACKRLDPRSLDDEPADLQTATKGLARDQIPDGA